jgi:hypothetical protein
MRHDTECLRVAFEVGGALRPPSRLADYYEWYAGSAGVLQCEEARFCHSSFPADPDWLPRRTLDFLLVKRQGSHQHQHFGLSALSVWDTLWPIRPSDWIC